MTRSERLLALAEHLRGRRSGTTVKDLAQRFQVTERTIHRDLDALRRSHLPVVGERGRGGGVALAPGYRLPPISFTAREAAVLIAAAEWLEAARVLPFVGTLRWAVDKVRAALPRERQRALDRVREALQFSGVPAPPVPDGVRQALEQAWFDDAPLRFDYRKADGTTQRRRARVRAIVMTRSETLLNCDDLDRGAERQFVLQRIVWAACEPATAAASPR